MTDASAEGLHCFVPTTLTLSPSSDGSMAGVHVAVKDLFAVAGHTSSFGHPQWRTTHEPAGEHSFAVGRLLGGGASVVGLAKMDQLAYSLIGNDGEGTAPVNPFDPTCFCGGSSSGSASAVAGGIAELGLGTDTAGSIRVPAAACGLFSLRPTHGRIPVDGVVPLAPLFDVVGLLARRPEVLAAAFGVLTVPEPTAKLRRVLLPGDSSGRLGPGGREALARLAHRIAGLLGSAVTEVDFDSFVSSEAGDLFARLHSREVWKQHGPWAEVNGRYLADDVQTRLRRCQTLSKDADAIKAADAEAHNGYVNRFRRLMADDAVLVVPVIPRRGPRRAWSAKELLAYRVECFRLTAPSSLTGAPQVVLPVSTEEGAATVPAAIVGWRGCDEALLALASPLAVGGERVVL